MIRLALISFEHVHAPHYAECLRRMNDVQLVAVAEPDAARLMPYSSLLAGIPVYTDYQKMLREVSIEGVIICSANSRHKQMDWIVPGWEWLSFVRNQLPRAPLMPTKCWLCAKHIK